MSKVLNEEFGFILTTKNECISNEPKYGVLAEHIKKVKDVETFVQIDQFNYVRYGMSRNMIVSLYKQIEEIEKKVFMTPFEDLPF